MAQSQLEWWTSDRTKPAILAHRVHVAVEDDAVVGVCETGEFAGEQVTWKLYLVHDLRGHKLGAELPQVAIKALLLAPGRFSWSTLPATTGWVTSINGLASTSPVPKRRARATRERRSSGVGASWTVEPRPCRGSARLRVTWSEFRCRIIYR